MALQNSTLLAEKPLAEDSNGQELTKNIEMGDKSSPKETTEFSLVKGGLLYRFLRWARIYDSNLEPIWRSAIIVTMIAWLPMLLLSVLGGTADGGVKIPFLRDVELHARILAALPLLLIGETIAERLIPPRVPNFIRRGIIRDADRSKFEGAIASAHRMRDSIFPELLFIALVYIVGLRFYGSQMASASVTSATWYATPDGVYWNLTPAGYWLIFFALPLFQFLLLRWYWRLAIWSVFLFRVSRLNLNLVPTHADRAAGLGFLTVCTYSFSTFLLAQGALLSGFIAGRIMHFGSDPRDYKIEVAALVVFLLSVTLAPLASFTPKMVRSRWSRGGSFATLNSQYINNFDHKWVTGTQPEDEQLLGTGDIQSLADIGNSYDVVREMRSIPFNPAVIGYLSALILIPLLPLILFVFSIEELAERLLKILL